jgi:hypothetical protein
MEKPKRKYTKPIEWPRKPIDKADDWCRSLDNLSSDLIIERASITCKSCTRSKLQCGQGGMFTPDQCDTDYKIDKLMKKHKRECWSCKEIKEAQEFRRKPHCKCCLHSKEIIERLKKLLSPIQVLSLMNLWNE